MNEAHELTFTVQAAQKKQTIKRLKLLRISWLQLWPIQLTK